MSWFKKDSPQKVQSTSKKGVPDGIWTKCKHCSTLLYQQELDAALQVCQHCGHHHYIAARTRLNTFLDKDAPLTFIGEDIQPTDYLNFHDSQPYTQRLETAIQKTGESEALIAVEGQLFGKPAVVAAFEFKFIGGSMSAVVGERFVLAAEQALAKGIPFVCFCASGGARMQEGMFSLMQMAKTAAIIHQLQKAKLPYITVLTHPTMGGVSASLAMLADIIIAEPNALIGFSGPRVIEQTIRHVLPEGFQKSEFLFEHGAIDMIVSRKNLRSKIAALLAKLMHQPEIINNQE